MSSTYRCRGAPLAELSSVLVGQQRQLKQRQLKTKRKSATRTCGILITMIFRLPLVSASLCRRVWMWSTNRLRTNWMVTTWRDADSSGQISPWPEISDSACRRSGWDCAVSCLPGLDRCRSLWRFHRTTAPTSWEMARTKVCPSYGQCIIPSFRSDWADMRQRRC